MMVRLGHAGQRTSLVMGTLAVAAVLTSSLLDGLAGASAASQPSVLTAIHASRHGQTDHLVFVFSGPPASFEADPVTQLTASAGDATPAVQGTSSWQITFTGVSGTGEGGQSSYGLRQRAFALPGLLQLATVQDKGGVLKFRIGVASHKQLQRSSESDPDRVVIDIPAPKQTGNLTVYFGTAGAAGLQPGSRPRPEHNRANMALWRLFAGPTQKELANGLQFVSAGATGFRPFRPTSEGVANVYLTGTCTRSATSSMLGREIRRTLRSLPSISAVRIYDAENNTGRTDPHGNSVPQCLEPVQPVGPGLLALLIPTALGLLLGVVLSLLSVVRGLRKAKIMTPAAYQARQVKRRPVAAGQFEPDTAWSFYPSAQLTADLGRIEDERRWLYGRLWKFWPRRPVYFFIVFPFWIVVLFCYLVAGVVTLLLGLLYALAGATLAAVAWGLAGAVTLLLRGADQAWHGVMRTAASCPRCFHVTAWPAYTCPGCGDLHRDIRPGKLGVLARRCKCGALLPTTVLRASRSLEAVCQRCRSPLRPGAAAIRDVRIPVFGDTSAGKTRLLYAGMDSLIKATSAAGVRLDFPDEDSNTRTEEGLSLIRSGRETVKTSTDMPVALTFRVGKGTGAALVHLFDAAGEVYKAADRHDSLGFLDRGHGLVYVLDPFSVGAIRERLTRRRAEVIRRARAAEGDPETAYNEVVTRLRDSGVQAEAQRLAAVVSKADLLIMGGLEPPTESEDIAEWLTGRGLHNLVLSMQREFAEVRFFTVASLAAAQVLPGHDPGAPLNWLLTSQGTRLPAGPDPLAGQRIPRSREGAADGGQMESKQGDTTAKAAP